MTVLTAAKRKKLPKDVFGLPDMRSYPMPDRLHAILAKGRAKQELKAGKLSASDYAHIVAMADKVLGK